MLLIILHISFALASFISMSLALAAKWRFRDRNFDSLVHLSGLSSIGLFVTGIGLVIIAHAKLQSVCLSGVFSLFSLLLLYGLYRRIAFSS